jgi:methionyl-tRNA synthetase
LHLIDIKRGKMVDLSALTSSTADPYSLVADLLGISLGAAIVIFTIISIWSLVWKGFALWKSAQKKSIVWFVVLLIINTLGILEILYIFVFSKMNLRKKTKEEKSKKK